MKITLPLPDDEEKEVIKLSKAAMKINTTRQSKQVNTKGYREISNKHRVSEGQQMLVNLDYSQSKENPNELFNHLPTYNSCSKSDIETFNH